MPHLHWLHPKAGDWLDFWTINRNLSTIALFKNIYFFLTTVNQGLGKPQILFIALYMQSILVGGFNSSEKNMRKSNWIMKPQGSGLQKNMKKNLKFHHPKTISAASITSTSQPPPLPHLQTSHRSSDGEVGWGKVFSRIHGTKVTFLFTDPWISLMNLWDQFVLVNIPWAPKTHGKLQVLAT